MSGAHTRGDEDCQECCCRQGYYHPDCGGKWHECIVDDTAEEGTIHNYKCDKCDEEDYRYGFEDIPIIFEASRGKK